MEIKSRYYSFQMCWGVSWFFAGSKLEKEVRLFAIGEAGSSHSSEGWGNEFGDFSIALSGIKIWLKWNSWRAKSRGALGSGRAGAAALRGMRIELGGAQDAMLKYFTNI